MNISLKMSKTLKNKPADDSLSFGKQFSDHMFIMNYSTELGWNDARIIPYGPLSLDPSTSVLHYGQGIFEGMKAYKSTEGKTLLFRPTENIKRLNASCERMCIPKLNEDDVLQAITTLVNLEKEWIPTKKGTSLYIRPYIIATDPFLGVHPSHNYMFIIILSPVGAYYKTGLNPIKIYVEDQYARAVKGGTGTAKAMGNYAASLKAQQEAEDKGCMQVLWLDGIEKKYIEEVGAMNVFFKIGNKVITPALSGSILPGITRKSTIQLLKSWNIEVEERLITVDELISAHAEGIFEECFGTGTAAVISPVGELLYKENSYIINDNKTGELSQKIYDNLTGIQYGNLADPFEWVVEI